MGVTREERKPGDANLEAAGNEAGEGELVNIRREGQAGLGGNFWGQGLRDPLDQGVLMAWGRHREAARKCPG